MRNRLFAAVAFLSLINIALPQSKVPENVPPLPSDIPKDAVMYTVITATKPAGQMALWDEGDAHHAFFQFNDRGRGPKFYSVSRIGSDRKSVV